MSGAAEVCTNCGAHYWLRSEDGRFCGECGLTPYVAPTLRQLLREAMERGHDPIGDHFDAVGRAMLAALATCAVVLGAIVWMVNAT